MNKIALAVFILSLIALTQAQSCRNCNLKNGKCVRVTPVGGGRPTAACQCNSQWTGLTCNKPITCIPKCKLGGQCFANENGNPVCSCANGYTGIDCGSLINLCDNQPCIDQFTTRCQPVLQGYICLPTDSEGGCVSTGQFIKCRTPFA